MQIFTNWIRSILILYFLMMIILYLAAGETYKKYIRFFMGLVLALTLLRPLLSLFGKEDALRDNITYESFRQEMEEAQFDFGSMEERENKVYKSQYEQALQMQFLQEAKEQLLDIRQIKVSLNEDFELQKVTIREGIPGDGEMMKQYLLDAYEIEEGKVIVE